VIRIDAKARSEEEVEQYLRSQSSMRLGEVTAGLTGKMIQIKNALKLPKKAITRPKPGK
jgi:hypothetical protein